MTYSSRHHPRSRQRAGALAGLLAVIAILAACADRAAPTQVPEPAQTPAIYEPAVAEPVPVLDESGTDIEEPLLTPSVTVVDQDVTNGAVVVAQVVSEGAGWLVIHAQADGKPGAIVGRSPVADGLNEEVTVEIDTAAATETLYAMLHTDSGETGAWEFPNGPDTPVSVDGMVVTPPFVVTGLPTPEPAKPQTPSVTVADQGIFDGTVTIAEVVSDGPGWLVVHAQSDGAPGRGIGVSPVADGINSEVVVEIDLANATETLYAMLHTDQGGAGALNLPYDPEDPLRSEGQVMTVPFKLQVASGTAEIEIEDFSFGSGVLAIAAGTTVRWSNRDAQPHTATSDTGIWDSGYLAKDEDFTFTFPEAGSYPYYCIPHGGPGGQGMSAMIVVIR